MKAFIITTKIISGLMVLALIVAFVVMAKTNTGIVKQFGIMTALSMSMAAAMAGAVIGLVLIKVVKR